MRALFAVFLLFFTFNSFAAKNSVVSEQRLATEVGRLILQAGGNAIDAAVAVGYALAVVDPCCGNIGGGGLMTIRLANGETSVINFRERAPLRATRNMFLDKTGKPIANASLSSYLAVGVPGTVMGLETALKKYGTMTRKQVMAPAIQLARKGFIISPYEAARFRLFANDFRQNKNVAAIFLSHNEPLPAGFRLIQTDLANTLQLISDHGTAPFYRGEIAKAIVKASAQHGGLLTMRDFADYNVQIMAPVTCDYRGYHIISAPPPSAGGVVLCEMLNILENFSLNHYQSATDVRYIVEAMRYGYRDRNSQLGDPNFTQNPVKKLLSRDYAKAISIHIRENTRAPVTGETIKHTELTDTTHYSVVDAKGNAVSVTYTLNGFFGSRLIAGETGFFLNNEMDDFETAPHAANKFGLVQTGDANAIAAGKRPLTSMTPTIITKDDKLYMVLGSPGGPRIISAVLLTILNTIDYHMPLQQAIDAPRFHYQGIPDSIDLEPQALPAATRQQLLDLGYHLTDQATWAAVEAIKQDPSSNHTQGANDRRRPDGAAVVQ